MNAMILAAGLGTRLRPYSKVRPKPLFPVLGRPLILHLLSQLRKDGFREVLVNAHFLSEQFVKLLKSESSVRLQLEEDILGTGGGLRMAGPSLGPSPFMVVNGDIIHSLDLGEIYGRHLDSGAPVSLVVHDNPRFNNLKVSADGQISAFRVGIEEVDCKKGDRLLAFAGIQVINPEVLHVIPSNGFFDIIDLYHQMTLSSGPVVKAIEVNGHFWTDIGTPADYLDLHGRLMTEPSLIERLGLDIVVDKPVHFSEGTVVGRNVEIEDWAFVGADAEIGDNARIIRSVIWDGARVPDGTVVEDKIVAE